MNLNPERSMLEELEQISTLACNIVVICTALGWLAG